MKPIQKSLFPELPARRPQPVLRQRAPRNVPRPRRTPLWLAVHLPQLSLQALGGNRPTDVPQASIASAAGAVRIHSVNAAALGAGVRGGMPLAAAWSLLPGLAVHERDVRRERAMLLRLVQQCHRFTPNACIDEQALLLEVRASLRLFDGAERLRENVQECLAQTGVDARFAMAPTPRAALWLARAGRDVHVDGIEDLPAVLGGVPLGVMQPEERLLERFRGIGARRLADLMRLPRDGLARRYGARVVRELDQALGRVPDVRCPIPSMKGFRERIELLYEITDVAMLLHPARELLGELNDWLQRMQLGASRLQLRFMHRDNAATSLAVGFASATRDRARIVELVEQKLESLALPGPVLAVALHCTDIVPLAGSDRVLFAEQAEGADWPQLVERLQARLGDAAVSAIEQCADHRPERAWRYVEPGKVRESRGVAFRPHWLLETPEPIRVHQGRPVLGGPLRIVAGPERIETGWWDEADVCRDYFLAEDVHGRALWICREARSGRWWLHGIYA